jgi:photosystem II stability/assembly factor-like uncharacterized protein
MATTEIAVALTTAAAEVSRHETAAALPVARGWQPLGPYLIPHGQTYGSGQGSRPAVAGRVAAVAVDPSNEQHILVGAAGGGVWESRDGGQTWAPRTDDQPSLAIGAIAFDPTNPLTVYAGTGEGDTTFLGAPNVRGAGLLRSTDGGTTWSLHASDPFVAQGFYDLLVDPEAGTHLLAATTGGLYESTDGGVLWMQQRNHPTWSLSKHPPLPSNPSAGQEVFAACDDGLFRSTNGGTTWSAVTLPGLPANFTPERMEARHAPANGSIVFVYTAGLPQILDPVNSLPGRPVRMWTPYLWRRATFGGTFTAVNTPPDIQTGQAWYDWFAAVAPNNADVVYLGAINVHRGVRQASGSWNWTNISAQANRDSIHPDQHTIAFSPTNANVLYVGNDGGIYHSPDAGTSWESLNKGLDISEIEFIAQHPEHEAWLLAGTQDNGTMRYEGEQAWYHVQDGDGGDCGTNFANPYTCFHSFYGMGLERSTEGGAWNAWNPSLTVPPSEDYQNGALFYPPLDVNGNVVARAGKSVFLSSDSGVTWTRKALPSNVGLSSALAIPTATLVYVGTTQGRLFRISRSGTNWQAPVELTSPGAGFMSDLLVDPTNANRLWCTINANGAGRVWRSTDGGSTWTNVSTGLPSGVAIHAIEIDASHPDTLFVALDVGVYRTTNGGVSWTSFSRNLPNVLVKDLLLHQPARLLRAGTQARGMWEIALDTDVMPDVEVYLRDNLVDTGRHFPSPSDIANPFQPGSQIFWWQSPDIKIDAPPFRFPTLDALDFASFSDDRSMIDGSVEFAQGLMNERAPRGQTVRVYVYVHNRGTRPATNVIVKVFFVNAGVNWPDLPADFWNGFPNNSIPANSPWQPVAAHRTMPMVEPGRGRIVGFTWPVPAPIGNAISLLAIVTADNDSIATTERSIPTLLRSSRYCALRNVAVINPSPLVAPTTRALLLPLWPMAGQERLSLSCDRSGSRLVRGILLSTRLAELAKQAGWPASALQSEETDVIAQLLHEHPDLQAKMDLSTMYKMPSKARLSFSGHADAVEEPVIVLIAPKAKRGMGSLVLRGNNDQPIGGITLHAHSQ